MTAEDVIEIQDAYQLAKYELAVRVRCLLTARQLTVETLSERCGVSTDTIYSILDKTANPTMKTLVTIGWGLGAKLDCSKSQPQQGICSEAKRPSTSPTRED